MLIELDLLVFGETLKRKAHLNRKGKGNLDVLSLKERRKGFSFMKAYESLSEVLIDHDLASLGDAYINFAYSLALSKRKGKASGAKVKGTALAEALRKAGLREYLPSRMTSHLLADAAEALIVYAWLCNCVTLEESVAILEKTSGLVDALTELIKTIKKRIKIS
jgi:hypothetical protein